ncbi:hypothetical protein ABK040_005644 [Willaertia magna]
MSGDNFSNVETVLGENKEIGVVDLYARSKLANILLELHSGGYYIDCKESKKYNEMVDSLELQEKLWNISLELCKPYLSN